MLYPALALLGICVCSVGALVGRKPVMLRMWLVASAFLGLWSMLLWANGHHNQHASNLWLLCNICILLPFISHICQNSCKPCIYAIAAVCIWLWFVHIFNHGIHAYAPMLWVAVSLSLVVCSALASLSGNHGVLLVTIALAALADAILYSFSLEWFRYNTPHAAWAVRNLLWCGVYISMAYTVRRR